jgi:hypothetical protein
MLDMDAGWLRKPVAGGYLAVASAGLNARGDRPGNATYHAYASGAPSGAGN